MSPDPRLLVPADAALIGGWCGPGMLDGRPVLIDGDNDYIVLLDGTTALYNTSYLPIVFDVRMQSLGTLSLDLSRAECRDRVVRVLARTAGPVWFGWDADARAWVLTGGGTHLEISSALDIDPTADTRLTDGSRLVEAFALAAVARDLLGSLR